MSDEPAPQETASELLGTLDLGPEISMDIVAE